MNAAGGRGVSGGFLRNLRRLLRCLLYGMLYCLLHSGGNVVGQRGGKIGNLNGSAGLRGLHGLRGGEIFRHTGHRRGGCCLR